MRIAMSKSTTGSRGKGYYSYVYIGFNPEVEIGLSVSPTPRLFESRSSRRPCGTKISLLSLQGQANSMQKPSPFCGDGFWPKISIVSDINRSCNKVWDSEKFSNNFNKFLHTF